MNDFIRGIRSRIGRVRRGVSLEYNIQEGELFLSGVNIVRHDQVLFKGLRAGKIQLRHSKHTGQTVLFFAEDEDQAQLGANFKQAIIAEYRRRIPGLIVKKQRG